MKLKILLVVCTLFSTVAMVTTSDKFDYLYAGDDDVEASKLLAATLRKTNLDWEAVVVPETSLIRLTAGSTEILVEPITFERGTDRILVTRLFTPKPGVTSKNTRYLAYTNELNNTFNDMKFVVLDGSSANLLMQRTYRFNNRLTTSELSVFIEEFLKSTEYVISNRFEDGLDEFFQ